MKDNTPYTYDRNAKQWVPKEWKPKYPAEECTLDVQTFMSEKEAIANGLDITKLKPEEIGMSTPDGSRKIRGYLAQGDWTSKGETYFDTNIREHRKKTEHPQRLD